MTTRSRRGRALRSPGRRWAPLLALIALMCAGACAPAAPPHPEVRFEGGGIGARWEAGGGEAAVATLRDAAGAAVTRVDLPEGASAAFFPVPWTPGERYSVEVRTASGGEGIATALAPRREGPVEAHLLAPFGQDRLLLPAEASLQAPPGGAAEFGVEVLAPRDRPVDAVVRIAADPAAPDPSPLLGTGEGPPGARTFRARLVPGGAPLVVALRVPVPPGGRRDAVEVRIADPADPGGEPLAVLAGSVRVEAVSRDVLAGRVELLAWRFPSDPLGRPLLDRPEDAVHLPADWWASLARAAGARVRARDAGVPWAHDGLRLRNAGDAALSLVVSERIVAAGTDREAPAFRPPLREEAASGEISQLVRVPASGEVRVALPLHVGRAARPGRYQRELRVSALGLSEPLWTRRAPLEVHRGDPLLAGAFGSAVTVGFAGLAWIALSHRRWLSSRPTAELMTIALFGTALSVIGFAADLLGTVAAAVLGPFQVLVLGLVQDLLRYSLVATLLLLAPRPGTAALAMTTGFGLHALALGGVSPTGLLFLGTAVALQESLLWVAGVTRGRWAEPGTPFLAQWIPLAAALTTASAASAFASLALHSVLYRLFFAPWYVALVVLVPSGLYVVIAAAVGLRLGRGLREVAP
ncbi:hypothetical protein L6R50_16160 [Myxococcota bacterium]|nr:hypothetical protein [Myxococcota bacterium]